MMTMAERMAVEIYRQFSPAGAPEWRRADPLSRNEARRVARALLTILRNPDSCMLDAMAQAVAADADLITEWRAGIDAAMAEDSK